LFEEPFTVRYYGKKTGREILLNHFLRAIILPAATLSRVGEQIFTPIKGGRADLYKRPMNHP
jgi:hypothetical protein